MLLAGAVLLGVVAIGTRRWWQDWLAARQAPQEPPRSDALRNRDERLKLALWASGEQFWDYDLVQRRLYRMRADETAVQTSDITVLTRQGEVPTIHEEDLPLVMERLRLHLQGKAPIFTSEHRMDMQGNGTWVWVRARGRVVDRVDAPSTPAMEAIGGTGDTLTGLLAALCAAGHDLVPAASLAARANRLCGALARPTPASPVSELIAAIPRALTDLGLPATPA